MEAAISRLWHSARLETAKSVLTYPNRHTCCHNIPIHTPQSGYHGVTEVAKRANIAKMAEKCIKSISARPTPPHMESGPGKRFLAQNRKKTKTFMIFDLEKGEIIFLPPTTTPTPPHLPKNLKKVGFRLGGGGGVRGGPYQKLIGGCIYWTK